MMMHGDHYILEDGEVIKVDLTTAARWLATDKDFSKRRVSSTYIGDVHISTVFSQFQRDRINGAVLHFETRVFGGEHDEYQERYSTLEEAMRGHERVVEMVRTTPPASPAG